MFFIGLSGSFIPYFLLAGFMLLSFMKINLNPGKDMELISDNSSIDLAFRTVETDSSIDECHWHEAFKKENKEKTEDAGVNGIILAHSESICIVSLCQSTDGILPENDYFGLSPPLLF